MKDKIKELIYHLGADVCGVASIDAFANAPNGFSPKDIWAECKSVIVFGKALPKGLFEISPRIVYEHYNNLSATAVDDIAFKSAKEIEKLFNAVAVPIPCDSPYDCWDNETLSGRGLISMKHAAVLAGLGTLGKNTMLINPEFGNRLTIGAIFTDIELDSDEPCQEMCLKGCSKCIDSCPVGAIKDGYVNQTLCRPNAYGKNSRGFDITKCNRCRTVCPLRFGKV